MVGQGPEVVEAGLLLAVLKALVLTCRTPPVSYTHLDVYKRQAVNDAGNAVRRGVNDVGQAARNIGNDVSNALR